jgi:mannose-6-phosphate isomerase-like protein (cupin superfamily)
LNARSFPAGRRKFRTKAQQEAIHAMTTPRIVHNQATAEYFFDEGCHITEWWNVADDEAASVARARVDPGVTTRLHRLQGITERYVILQGNGLVEVGTLAPQAVGPGDVVVIPPGVPQRVTNTGGSDLLFLAVCTPRFTPSAYENLDCNSE